MTFPLITSNTACRDFLQEKFPDNYEPKLALTFVLDVSSSMRGEGIRQLNQGLKVFQSFFRDDPTALARLEISIVTFGSDVRVVRNFSSLEKEVFPLLNAGGRTLMKQGLETAFRLLGERKSWYRNMGLQYYRPYVIMITDGSPWPDKNLGNLPAHIQKESESKRFIFQAFGAGKANMKILSQLSHQDFPPQKISGYNFSDFFRWFAPSISTMVSQPVKMLNA